jgi:CRISPR system Cascade subunit CasB
MSESEKRDFDKEFVEALETLVKQNNRAELAKLRRGLGKKIGESMEVYPFVFSRTYIKHNEQPYSLIAPLFAHYPNAGKTNGNLGFSVNSIREESGSIEKRFVALLNADEEDLPYHLRQIISLLKSKEKPINWLQLLKDIKNWSHEDRFVQRNWARGFWGNSTENTKKGEEKQ